MRVVAAVLLVALAGGCSSVSEPRGERQAAVFAPEPGERHFGPLRRLTDGGENAEAYFSFDGRRLVFQSTRPPLGCDRIFSMKTDGSDLRAVSSGQGRTTCAYYLPGGRRILYASTHLGGNACPPPPDMSHGYTWAVYPDYDIFVTDTDGGHPVRLTDTPGYDAEATISPRGDRIVFTSVRGGDLDIWSMKLDGSDVRQLTNTPGYDGGAFFSPDGSKIVFRAHPFESEGQLAEYRRLLQLNLVRPSQLEIFTMNADGSDRRQLTKLGSASFAPFFHPAGKKIVFSSNYPDPRGREFELYMIDTDGGNLEKITSSAEFDGFPMFAPDGKTFVFCSNRHNTAPGNTNVFITTWKD